MVDTNEIKKLREETGVSIMQCKKALEEADGDFEKAKVILQKKASAIAAKKADRSLGAGTIAAYIHGEGSVGAMVELSCETDFVAKNEEFKELAYEFAMQVAATNPKWLSREDVGEDEMNRVKEVLEEDIDDSKKDMKDKIMDGKMASHFKESVLLEQNYIKDESKTIEDLLSEAVQKFGERTEIRRFARFSVSE